MNKPLMSQKERRDSVKGFWREYYHRFGVELDNDAADFVNAYADQSQTTPESDEANLKYTKELEDRFQAALDVIKHYSDLDNWEIEYFGPETGCEMYCNIYVPTDRPGNQMANDFLTGNFLCPVESPKKDGKRKPD